MANATEISQSNTLFKSLQRFSLSLTELIESYNEIPFGEDTPVGINVHSVADIIVEISVNCSQGNINNKEDIIEYLNKQL